MQGFKGSVRINIIQLKNLPTYEDNPFNAILWSGLRITSFDTVLISEELPLVSQ